MEFYGIFMDVYGNFMEFYGISIDVYGNTMEVYVILMDFHVICFDVYGISWDSNRGLWDVDGIFSWFVDGISSRWSQAIGTPHDLCINDFHLPKGISSIGEECLYYELYGFYAVWLYSSIYDHKHEYCIVALE